MENTAYFSASFHGVRSHQCTTDAVFFSHFYFIHYSTLEKTGFGCHHFQLKVTDLFRVAKFHGHFCPHHIQLLSSHHSAKQPFSHFLKNSFLCFCNSSGFLPSHFHSPFLSPSLPPDLKNAGSFQGLASALLSPHSLIGIAMDFKTFILMRCKFFFEMQILISKLELSSGLQTHRTKYLCNIST